MHMRLSVTEVEEATWQGPETGQQPARKWGPRSYNCKEINSANNLRLLRNGSPPSCFQMRVQLPKITISAYDGILSRLNPTKPD